VTVLLDACSIEIGLDSDNSLRLCIFRYPARLEPKLTWRLLEASLVEVSDTMRLGVAMLPSSSAKLAIVTVV
jgi:hypothetical protein